MVESLVGNGAEDSSRENEDLVGQLQLQLVQVAREKVAL